MTATILEVLAVYRVGQTVLKDVPPHNILEHIPALNMSSELDAKHVGPGKLSM